MFLGANNYKKMNEQRRYKELDALRGVAALFVVFFHFTMGREEYNSFFKLGTTGVDLFFIISGFVIFMSLQKISKGIDFVINRISRLYPTYWTCVFFTFIMISSFSIYTKTFIAKTDLITLSGNLSMFQFYFQIKDLEATYWTMIIEMIFYISMYVLYKLDALKYITTIGIISCIVDILIIYYFHDIYYIKEIIYWIPLLQFLPLFFAGIIFYKIRINKENKFLNYGIIIFCLFCQFALFPDTGRSRRFISRPEYIMMLSLYFVLFILFVNFKLSFIVNQMSLFFGRISFALYLTHCHISLFFIIPLFYNRLGINFWIVLFFINLPIVTAIATVITYKIEIPYSKKMKAVLHTIATFRYKH